MADEAHVFLAVLEFGSDTAVVTELMGFAPTKAWTRGEPLPNHPTATRNHSRWTFQSSLPLQSSVEDHLEALLPLLEQHGDRVRRCAASFPTQLWCAIYYRDFTPTIRLSPNLLRRISELGLHLDLDLYFLGAG